MQTLKPTQIALIYNHLLATEPDAIIPNASKAQTVTNYIKDELECRNEDGDDITESQLIDSLLHSAHLTKFEADLKQFITEHPYNKFEDTTPEITPTNHGYTINIHTVDGDYERIQIDIAYIA